jgi:hypothetical protein
MKNQDFTYEYRGCLAHVKYKGVSVSISIYDTDEGTNYGKMATYEALDVSMQDLIYQAQCLVDDIRNDEI